MEDSNLIDTLVCRICLEDDIEENLIHPCKCSGSSKYVHKQCLNEWRNINHNPISFNQCEVCKYTYVITNNISNCDNICYKIKKHYIYFLMFNIIITYLISLFLMYYIDINNFLCKYFSTERCGALYIFFSSVGINICFLFYILVYSLSIKNKDLYCKLFIKDLLTLLSSGFLLYLLFMVFDSVLCFLVLQVIFVYIIHLHVGIIEEINKDKHCVIENYNSNEVDEIELEEIS